MPSERSQRSREEFTQHSLNCRNSARDVLAEASWEDSEFRMDGRLTGHLGTVGGYLPSPCIFNR
jgi:hypothetical protein